jgi:hypothetical protein
MTKLFQDNYLRKACRKILDILAPDVLDDAIKQVQRWKLLLLWHLLTCAHKTFDENSIHQSTHKAGRYCCSNSRGSLLLRHLKGKHAKNSKCNSQYQLVGVDTFCLKNQLKFSGSTERSP